MTTLNQWQALLWPIADDDWMMGHRGSEWLALAPDLEEDLATSSISQDELGHGALIYGLLEDLGDVAQDRAVYSRDLQYWRHARLTDAPPTTWAEWVFRRYVYEVFDAIRRWGLQQIPYVPLQQALRKMEPEESYHLAHYRHLMAILAHGGPTSQHFLQDAIIGDWPKLPELFSWGSDVWTIWNVAPLDPNVMQRAFSRIVQADFDQWPLSLPGPLGHPTPDARHHENSSRLRSLLKEMREVRDLSPDSLW